MINSLFYDGYTASIYYSPADEVFFGKLIGVNDLVTFEGTSVEALKQGMQEAVDDYIETCRLLGKSPEKSYKGVFNVRVSSDLHKKIALLASQYNVTLNDFVKSVLQYASSHQEIGAEVFGER
ncbi:type II toxin-antitoxin system HicB family antitoxin [Dyadobacter sp. Leaf189]|uniref:type II toxin-antitoxin system HicB family antitoxin n=1 Tax=Dyadobacter sp. Leaf189 TaxID=1736295 RepID=UPI0006FDD058|nr:type II toxin-antitoxin system HicB family antitoxin [Dyadobacter sp. Leaf189]KQS26869.1 DNA repair protein [Dyadobacter sp. Leaf189]